MNLGGYEILGELGRGGAGVVFKARSPEGRTVALKVLLAKDAQKALKSFERERRMLDALGAEGGFVPLLDAGESPRGPFIVMPFLAGGTLRDRLRRGQLDVADVIELGVALSNALARAHERGIVHRDLKPENVLFAEDGRPLIADLGLAKHYDKEALGAGLSVSLSKTGDYKGSSGYMAPEQMADAKGVGPPADVFSLGAILYECLAGQGAFEGQNEIEIFGKIESGSFEALRVMRPETPRWLERVVGKALATRPEKRYPSALELEKALASGGGGGSRVPLVLAVALIRACGGAAAAFLGARAHAPSPPPGPPPAPKPVQPQEKAFPPECASFLRSRNGLFRLAEVYGSYEWHSGGPVSVVRWIAGGKQVLSSSGDGFIRLWDARTGRELKRFLGGRGVVLHFAPTPSGDRLVATCKNELVVVDVQGTRAPLALVADGGMTYSCEPLPDGKRVLTTHQDGGVRLWDLETGSLVRTLTGHRRGATAVAALPGGRAVSQGLDDTLRVWDVEQGTEVRRVDLLARSSSSLAVAKDGHRAFTGSTEGPIDEWDLDTGARGRTLAGHEGLVCTLRASPDGTRLVSAGFDGTVRLWDPSTGKEVQCLRGHVGAVLGADFSPDGALVASTGKDSTIRRWDVATGRELERPGNGHDSWVRALVRTPDGKRVLSGSLDQTVRSWELGSDRPPRTIQSRGEVASVAVSLRGDRLLAGTMEAGVELRDLASGALVVTLGGQDREVRAVAFFSDGERAVTGNGEGSVCLWDLSSGAELRRFQAHSQAVMGLALADDRTLVTIGKDRTLKVWDLSGSGAPRVLEGHRDEIHGLTLLSGGERAATVGIDRTLRLWDLAPSSAGEIGVLDVRRSVPHVVAVFPDERRALSASEDFSITLWDLDRRVELDELDLSSSGEFVTSMLVGPDGRWFLAGTTRGTILRFEATR